MRPKNRTRCQLPFPATPQHRIAQITAAPAIFESAQFFPRDRWRDLKNFEPQVLVGAAPDLLHLCRDSELLGFTLSVDYAIFVVTQCGRSAMTDVERVSLWQAFGVPLFELFMSPRGSLLASECEAHEGWHIEQGNYFSLVQGRLILDEPLNSDIETGLTAEFDHNPCPCGREGMRLINIDRHVVYRVRRALAATA